MDDRSRWKRSLLGLSAEKVSAYLRQMKHLQAQEIAELEALVAAEEAAHARLREEWEAVRARYQAGAHQAAFRNLLKQRVQDAVRAMQEQAQQEVAALQMLVEQKQVEYEQKMERIEQQADAYSETLQKLLQEFGTTMQQFQASTMAMGMSGSELGGKSDNVVPFTLRALTEERVPERAGLQVEADAAALVELASSLATEGVEVAGMAGSDFWGNLGAFVAGEMEREERFEEEEIEGLLVEEPRVDTTVSQEDVATTDASKESGALSAEILSIRNRYIVGKWAGEDLFDEQGRLIVTRDATITPEIVQRAERAGKLPDLIVNMKIPGQRDVRSR